MMLERLGRTRTVFTSLALLALLVGCTQLEAEVGSDPPSHVASKCDSTASLGLYYWNVRPEQTTELIDFLVKVENRTGAAVALATLSVRYYFREESSPPGLLFGALLAALVAALLTRRLGAAGPYHDGALREHGSDALA